MMIGHKPNYYWIVCWLVLTPAMVAVRRLTAHHPATYLKIC